MTTDPRPFETLRGIALRAGTGEFICASRTAEVHVYLQRGRLAWATDSEHPFAFTRHLQETAEIDPDSFRDILESCRREKRPLGETLVSWGVASWDDVRGALRHQIELALDVLCRGGPGQTVFLDRTEQFARYESTLTFDVAELDTSADDAAPRSDQTPAPVSLARDDEAARIVDAVDGVVWAQLLAGVEEIDVAPKGARATVAGALVEATVLDGAELVALRTPEGTLAGAALPARRSLWCRLAPDATVGSALATLSTLATHERAPEPAAIERSGRPWTVGGDASIIDALRDFLGHAPETLAALVTDLDDRTCSCGAGGALAPEYVLDLAHKRSSVLAVAAPLGDDAPPRADDVGFRFRSMVTRERTVWCFGAELLPRRRSVLWLVLSRQCSQGLGWAYLTSLGRRLMHTGGRLRA
ncbi:MAG: hypothetical protein KIT84_16685 [Labilithrix sp.]|nr:hypothetical protein [Labilithrix sp.]MCW5812668.1 hypothetical protein [Labilithrix sp.]